MSTVNPTREALSALLEVDPDKPVVMLNLLKYRQRADYGDDPDAPEISGQEAYRIYGKVAQRMLDRVGARVLWMGRPQHTLVGGPEGDWDEVLLVRYPSRRAFIEMLQIPEYQQATRHREAALERARLIANRDAEG